jgi:hypothetical protein
MTNMNQSVLREHKKIGRKGEEGKKETSSSSFSSSIFLYVDNHCILDFSALYKK